MKNKEVIDDKEIIPGDKAILYRSYWDAVKHLPEEDIEKWAAGLMRYAFEGKIPDFETGSTLHSVFQIVKQNMISSSISLANGLKGGRPKKK